MHPDLGRGVFFVGTSALATNPLPSREKPTMPMPGQPASIFQTARPRIDLAWEQRVILTLYQQGKMPEVEQAARRLTQLAPQFAFGWKVLGVALQQLDRPQDALPAMQQAARLQPGDPEALNNLGALFEALERPDDALTHYEQALQSRPDFKPAMTNLLNLLRRLKVDNALLPLLLRLQRLRPQDEQLQFMVAMLTGQTVDRPPREYVSHLFDLYADRFDEHLQGELAYAAPGQLAAMLAEHTAPASGWRVLDLGCGTGLVGAELADRCQDLVGVDLSAAMLAKAKARGGYTRLMHGDVRQIMEAEAGGSFDIVVAADVFIYVGRIDEVVAHARRLLANDGLLAFTVESMESAVPAASEADLQRGHRLEPSGRYTHADAHLRDLASRHGFDVVRHDATTIRQDRDRAIEGQLVLWRARS